MTLVKMMIVLVMVVTVSEMPELPPLHVVDKMAISEFMNLKSLDNMHKINRNRMKLWVKVFYKYGKKNLPMTECIAFADRAVDGFDSLFGTGDDSDNND